MSLIQAILLGLIQGMAEFLPISSSGHLVILKNIFQLKTDTDKVYDIMLHLGTLIAVFVVYWKDIKELIIEGFCILGGWCTNAGRFQQFQPEFWVCCLRSWLEMHQQNCYCRAAVFL